MNPMQTTGIAIAWNQVDAGLKKRQLFDGIL